MVVDLDLNLQFMSSAGIEVFKFDDITEYYGKAYPFDFYPKQFKTDMVNNLLQAIDTDEVISFEGSILDVNDKELWLESTIVPVKDEQDITDSLLVISVNITLWIFCFIYKGCNS